MRSVPPVAILALLACSLVYSLGLAGCEGGKTMRPYGVAMNGNPDQGKQIIQGYGCGSCHIIPGIRSARGLVGPPLYFFSQRTIIAGELPNTPPNLVRWIENPRAIEPNTAMPDLGLTAAQSNDVAAYLYTIR